jgi:hypothetical protein
MAGIPDEYDPDIVKYTYINIPSAEEIRFNVSYNFSWKGLSSYSTIGMQFPFIEVPFVNDMKKIRTPTWQISINNDYAITESIDVFANLTFYKGLNNLVVFDEMYNVSTGLTAKLFDDKLHISLEMNDMFDTYNLDYIREYGNIVDNQFRELDSRYLRVSLKYYLNEFEEIIKKRSGSEEERGRIK